MLCIYYILRSPFSTYLKKGKWKKAANPFIIVTFSLSFRSWRNVGNLFWGYQDFLLDGLFQYAIMKYWWLVLGKKHPCWPYRAVTPFGVYEVWAQPLKRTSQCCQLPPLPWPTPAVLPATGTFWFLFNPGHTLWTMTDPNQATRDQETQKQEDIIKSKADDEIFENSFDFLWHQFNQFRSCIDHSQM